MPRPSKYDLIRLIMQENRRSEAIAEKAKSASVKANLPSSQLEEQEAKLRLNIMGGRTLTSPESTYARERSWLPKPVQPPAPSPLEKTTTYLEAIGGITTSKEKAKVGRMAVGLEPRATQPEKPVDVETKRTRLELLKEQLKRTREQKTQSTKGIDKYLTDIDKFGKIADESEDENIKNFALERMQTSIDSANVLLNGKKLYPQLKTQQVMDLWGEWESVLDEFDSQVNDKIDELMKKGLDEDRAKKQAKNEIKTLFQQDNDVDINQVKQAINALKRPVKANITKEKSW